MPLLCLSSRRTRCALVAVTLGVFAREAAAQDATTVNPPASSPPPTFSPAPTVPLSVGPPAQGTPSAPENSNLVGPTPPPHALMAAPPPQDKHPLAFRADFKLPFTVSTLLAGEGEAEQNPFAPVPQLVLGFQFGRIGVGVGLGFMRLSASTTGVVLVGASTSSSSSIAEPLIAPTLTVDLFQSNDGKVALYVLGAPIFGDIIITNESSESDVGFQFALGANLALHENFRVGLEAGPVGHFYSVGDNQSLSTISLYTALVGTFVYPR